MRLGDNFFFILVISLFYSNITLAEQKIINSPLLNIDDIKPSFEELDEKREGASSIKTVKKKKNLNTPVASQAILIGLDKITAKSLELTININENKRFGPLEIKILKCGKARVNNKIDSVAYMQVKDLTKNDNEQIFIFNGWTFASDPSLTPFDHAVYNLKLISCSNV